MKMNHQNRIFRRLNCPIYFYDVCVEITCVRAGCIYWNGTRCTHGRQKKLRLPKRGYLPERPRFGRRGRGLRVPTVYEEWQRTGHEQDSFPDTDGGTDYGLAGSFEEGHEPQPEPFGMEDAGLGEPKIGEPDSDGEPEIVVGEPDLLAPHVSDLIDGPLSSNPLADPLSPSPLSEPVIGPPGLSPVSDPVLESNPGLTGLGGLPDLEDHFGGKNGP